MPAESAYLTEAARWRAIQARDARADGHFVYAVRSTGVYSHPSSAARLPRRRNVAFFPTASAAEAAGYRASRRSRGNRVAAATRRTGLVTQACRLIAAATAPLTLTTLATRLGVSPWHLHRIFKAETGLTPKAYGEAERARKLRAALNAAGSVTDAIYDAGYASSGRYYAEADALLGMRAREWRAGGAGTRIRFAIGQCTLGAILVAESERGICAILLGDDPERLARDLQDQFPKAELIGGDAAFERVVAQVVGCVEYPARGLDLPLDVRGTAFQQRVWQALRAIPPGTTASYADIAQRIGAPKAVRAVAQACAANHLAVAIPCHRVVRRDGALSGYRWGVERKAALLRREGVVPRHA